MDRETRDSLRAPMLSEEIERRAFRAGQEDMRRRADEAIIAATAKWCNPNGTPYEQGGQDHGNRCHAAVSRLPILDKAEE